MMNVRSRQEISGELRGSDLGLELVTKRVGASVYLFETVDSTNEEAARLAAGGATEGTIVLAEGQRRGRGRMGRRWSSPPRLGLYLSVVLRPAIPPQSAPALALLGAVASCEAIERVANLEAEIKWPNDVVMRGRKVGGVLGEIDADPARIRHVILGIGLNLNQGEGDFEAELRPVATSLRIESGRYVDRIEVTRAVCECLDRWYDRFLVDGVDSVIEAVRRRCRTLGQGVVARVAGHALRGVAVDMDGDGALMIRDDDGRVRRLVAGDVTLAG
jgi:BirA family biotin operon repressor/biotin-[acetyl-CoA-carboxylase] ligase